MRILHIVPGRLMRWRGQVFSMLASVRLRALAPAPALLALGHEVRVVEIGALAQKLDQPGYFDVDVIVLHKVYEDVAALLDRLPRGPRLVVDLTDPVAHRPHYAGLLARADAVTVPTPALAALLGLPGGATVIDDAVEGERLPPAFPEAPEARLLWFGWSDNIAPMAALCRRLPAAVAGRPLHLTAVCDDGPGRAALLAAAEGRFAITFKDWWPETAAAALAWCQAVLLPSGEGPRWRAKSANRLATALWAGRMALADPHPAFAPFADAAFIGDIPAGLERLFADPAAALPRIAAGQARIGRCLAPPVVAARWAELFAALAPGPRLNLGCGDKPLPGYINLDRARRGRGPDLICDLTAPLPFADGTVAEILSVHMIEHLDRWQVPEILARWRRALRPGGRIVLECPNLLSACAAILADPEGAVEADGRGRRGMWPLYGDPSWRDPLMMHRWGYTPGSLIKLLREAGFEDCRQEPARFKLREPRDMRIVGRRPASGEVT
ncbi:MAG: hypothetical protein OHK0024_28790 [Thalassobaculales bacterium]